MRFTNEQLKKKTAKSEGELSDEKLDKIAGGTNKYGNDGEDSIENYTINEGGGGELPYEYVSIVCSIRNISVEPCPFSDDYRRLVGANKNCDNCPRNPKKQHPSNQ